MKVPVEVKNMVIHLKNGVSVVICDEDPVPSITLQMPENIQSRYHEMGTKPETDIITFFDKQSPPGQPQNTNACLGCGGPLNEHGICLPCKRISQVVSEELDWNS